MKNQKDRLKEMGMFALPPEGTAAYQRLLDYHNKNHKNNPEFKKIAKSNFEKAFSIAKAQDENGAGLPTDKEIRHFHREFNDRNWKHGLRSLPSAFNVMEGLFNYRPNIQLFELLEEEDHFFNMYDFVDFVTSPEFNQDPLLLKDYLAEDLIYNYNISNLLNDITFTTEDGGVYVIGGISIVKRGNEAIVFMLTGETIDPNLTIDNLDIDTSLNIPGKENIKPHEDYKLEAVRLFGDKNYWKTLAFCRIDLEKLTIDKRYIQKDIGVGYDTITDDISGLVDMNGNFFSEGLKESYEKMQKDIVHYSPLFEVAVKSLFLPYYFNKFEDQIIEEEYETTLGQQRQKKPRFKKDRIVPAKYSIKARPVWRLDKNENKSQDTIYFGDNGFKLERDGFWKNIDYSSMGKDKKGNPIQGRTWVDITQTWYEIEKQTLTVNVNSNVIPNSSNPNVGSIYIMRNASHEIDIFKIGLTTRTAKIRAKELSSTTGAADKFLTAEEWNVKDCVLAEKLIHEKLDKFRINSNREFFKVEYSIARKIVQEVVDQINKEGSN